ncbi:hypothetical protein PsorP6_015037 [Peronosclerospora sorghi]|uniref:Uncharacterized protein n=1 Tax=Peronosclerospora sorghi TaxID=230839 RepID=A0ACC0VV74_9STRA|nr:hypothetical protein PsorP6_015037 [Peronosclerospora sorghi]
MEAKQDALVDVIRAIVGPRDMSREHILAIIKQAGDDTNKAVDLFFQTEAANGIAPKDVHSFFTAGGFALTHANSVTDIACVELVKVEEIDPEAAQAGLTKYQAQLASAPEGSEEKLNAQIVVETHAAMVAAVSSN